MTLGQFTRRRRVISGLPPWGPADQQRSATTLQRNICNKILPWIVCEKSVVTNLRQIKVVFNEAYITK